MAMIMVTRLPLSPIAPPSGLSLFAYLPPNFPFFSSSSLFVPSHVDAIRRAEAAHRMEKKEQMEDRRCHVLGYLTSGGPSLPTT